MREVHFCSFNAGSLKKKDFDDYEMVKDHYLKIGKFSCFEASETAKIGRVMTRLCHDPEIETFDLGYPWTGIRRAEPMNTIEKQKMELYESTLRLIAEPERQDLYTPQELARHALRIEPLPNRSGPTAREDGGK